MFTSYPPVWWYQEVDTWGPLGSHEDVRAEPPRMGHLPPNPPCSLPCEDAPRSQLFAIQKRPPARNWSRLAPDLSLPVSRWNIWCNPWTDTDTSQPLTAHDMLPFGLVPPWAWTNVQRYMFYRIMSLPPLSEFIVSLEWTKLPPPPPKLLHFQLSVARFRVMGKIQFCIRNLTFLEKIKASSVRNLSENRVFSWVYLNFSLPKYSAAECSSGLQERTWLKHCPRNYL